MSCIGRFGDKNKFSDRVRSYFARFPWFMGILMLIAAWIWWGALTDPRPIEARGWIWEAIWLGILVVGCFRFMRWAISPKDEEIDEFLSEAVEMARKRAMERNNLEVEQLQREPVLTIAPVAAPVTREFSGCKMGRDLQYRYTPSSLTILLFTEDFLASYQCVVDLEEGSFTKEMASQFFYEDLVAVQVGSYTPEPTRWLVRLVRTCLFLLKGSLGREERQRYKMVDVLLLTTKSGRSVEVLIPHEAQIWNPKSDGFLMTPGLAVRAVQKMVAEKKRDQVAQPFAVA